MSRDVAKTKSSTLPGDLPSLNPKHSLNAVLFVMLSPMSDGMHLGPYSPEIRASAREAIARFEPYERPVTEKVLREWLAPIPQVVRNEKTTEALKGWMAGVMLALRGFPIGAFNQSTQRSALQTFQFFPSAADVCDVLQPTVTEIRDRMRALRQVAMEDAP